MNDLMLSLGIEERKGVPVVSSRKVAEVFGKLHKNVIQSIENLECSSEFRRLNFQPTSTPRKMPRGGERLEKEYQITRDGFSFLAMGFTGEKAARFKEAYIRAFNSMENALTERRNVRVKSIAARNQFTDCLQRHGYKNPYEYANTTNQMKAVLGVYKKKGEMDESELGLITACEIIAKLNIERAGAIGYREVNPLCLKSSVAVSHAVNPALIGRL